MKSPRPTSPIVSFPWLLALLLIATGPLAAQDPEPPAAPAAAETEAFDLEPPEGWEAVELSRLTVPGEALAAWSPDGVTGLAVFMQRPGQSFDAATVLERSVGAAEKVPTLTVETREVRQVAGREAMWLVMTGPGTGGSIGQGEVPTTQHWVAIPRGEEILVFLLTTPKAEYDARLEELEAVLATLELP